MARVSRDPPSRDASGEARRDGARGGGRDGMGKALRGVDNSEEGERKMKKREWRLRKSYGAGLKVESGGWERKGGQKEKRGRRLRKSKG